MCWSPCPCCGWEDPRKSGAPGRATAARWDRRFSSCQKRPQAAEAHAPSRDLAVAETPLPNFEVRASQQAESGTVAPPRPWLAATQRTGPQRGRVENDWADPSASDSPQTGAVSRDSSLHLGPPQVDVTRDRVPASDGGGEAYTVRLADSGGRPLAGADVFLRIRMADGTLLDLSLGPEPIRGPTPSRRHPSGQPRWIFGSAWSRTTLASRSL